jgi:hypothetical protein
MAAGFKVKLEDGSVVGPLDTDMLRSWYQQGLIDKDTPVLAGNARRWEKLRDVLDVPQVQLERAKKKGQQEAGDEEEAADGDYVINVAWSASRFGRVIAGAVLIAGAAGAIAALLLPEVWRADLSPAPWREIGYVQVILALMALHEAEWTRRLTRIAVCLAAFAVFPVMGMVIAQGVPLDAIAVLGSAWLLATGLFYLLAPTSHWKQLTASLAAVLLGAFGVVRFGVVLGAGAAAASAQALGIAG